MSLPIKNTNDTKFLLSYIPTGRKLKGKGRGGKIPQGAQKGKVQFQGKKIKFEEEGEDDTKTGMLTGYRFFIAQGYFMDKFLFTRAKLWPSIVVFLSSVNMLLPVK